MQRIPRSALGALVGALCVVGLVSGCTADGTDRRAPSTAPVPTPSGYRLTWNDEFTGHAGPVGGDWQHALGGNGWGNGELECYTDDTANSALDGDGHLVITAARRAPAPCSDGHTTSWTSARLTTKQSFSVTHGRIEIRARIPTAAGTWPAFWMLAADDDQVPWPESGEIDVFESDGRDPMRVFGSVHGATPAGEPWALMRHAQLPVDLGAGFHTYAVDWTADSFTYSVDGKAYGTITRSEVEAQGPWVFDRPFYLLVDLAVGGALPGTPPSSTSWPQRFAIDWVRVYSRTEGSGAG